MIIILGRCLIYVYISDRADRNPPLIKYSGHSITDLAPNLQDSDNVRTIGTILLTSHLRWLANLYSLTPSIFL